MSRMCKLFNLPTKATVMKKRVKNTRSLKIFELLLESELVFLSHEAAESFVVRRLAIPYFVVEETVSSFRKEFPHLIRERDVRKRSFG